MKSRNEPIFVSQLSKKYKYENQISVETIRVNRRIIYKKREEIQLTHALIDLAKQEEMFAYDFKGKRYDVGNKLGFLQVTVEMALKRDKLKDEFLDYLKTVVEREISKVK